MTTVTPPATHPHTFSWGLLVALVVLGMSVAFGFSSTPVVLLVGVLAVVWAFRYIYVALYTGIFLTPFLGVMISIPTGSMLFGQRSFGGSVDVSLAEAILLCVLAAWSLKMLFLWRRRRDQNWQPQWPLLWAYAPMVGAHVASLASPLLPDPYLVAKFILRPVVFVYLAFIALPVNLIRSRRRLHAALGTMTAVGMFAAVNGLFAMFLPESGGAIGRAHPLGIFGVPALGENHNELAELLVVTAPTAYALSRLVTSLRARRLLVGAAVFQFVIGLFTFTRTIWIAFAVQGAFLGWTVWRATARRHMAQMVLGVILLLPFAIGMAFYSVSNTAQSSNSTRLMLTQIAGQVFESSPLLGGGAGTFFQRVGSTQAFLIEYGDPLDSHGFIQKLAAETGILGLIALGIFLLAAARWIYARLQRVEAPLLREASFLLIASSGGAFMYQLFNTSYWSGKLWLPLGLLLAALNVFVMQERGFDGDNRAILET